MRSPRAAPVISMGVTEKTAGAQGGKKGGEDFLFIL